MGVISWCAWALKARGASAFKAGIRGLELGVGLGLGLVYLVKLECTEWGIVGVGVLAVVVQGEAGLQGLVK